MSINIAAASSLTCNRPLFSSLSPSITTSLRLAASWNRLGDTGGVASGSTLSYRCTPDETWHIHVVCDAAGGRVQLETYYITPSPYFLHNLSVRTFFQKDSVPFLSHGSRNLEVVEREFSPSCRPQHVVSNFFFINLLNTERKMQTKHDND